MNDTELETPLTVEEIADMEDAAESLLEEIDEYRNAAEAINDRKINEDPRPYTPLDDQPFGEELVRTEEARQQVTDALDLLKLLKSGTLTEDEQSKVSASARDLVDEAESTLRDCSPIPQADEDEDWE